VGQPIVISVTSTKGGVGKTTVAANLGAILASFGMKVLLIDADIQPSLSRYFPIKSLAKNGLSEIIKRGGVIQPDSISTIDRPNMDIVVSDADSELQTWLKDREDRLFILKRATRGALVRDNYHVVIIDTQGAVGELQKTAAMAADIMLSPVNPTILSVREFSTGTLAMLESLNRLSDVSSAFRSGDLYVLISGLERTNDSKLIADKIRRDFVNVPMVRVLQTVIPSSSVYKTAATMQSPAFELDRPPSRKAVTAYDTLHALVWELFPHLAGMHCTGPEEGQPS
jgi:chromosome partitioning related protein ParA